MGTVVNRSAIILATGISEISGQDLATLNLGSKPLIQHVLDIVSVVTDETIVVVDSDKEVDKFSNILDTDLKYIISESATDLGDAESGLQAAIGKLSILLNYNMPFVSPNAIDLLFELCQSKSAVVPRWPDRHIESTHAVFNTAVALKASQIALEDGLSSLTDLVDCMSGVRYLSTLVVQEMDPELRTFFQVRSLLDLKRAENMMKPRKRKL
jgi:molybdopterin-guanine dinucleotide biosynthesis protein A